MKRKFIGILLLLTLLVLSSISYADGNEVYIVPIKGEINHATYNFLNHTMDKIIRENPKAM